MVEFIIDQAGLSAGAAGISRDDGLSTGAEVTLTYVGPSNNVVFRILDTPYIDNNAVGVYGDQPAITSLAVTADPNVWTFTPTDASTTNSGKIFGKYLIECVINAGTPQEESRLQTLGIRSPLKGLLPPALNEQGVKTASLLNRSSEIIARTNDNSIRSGTNSDANQRQWDGWKRDIFELIATFEEFAGGAGSGDVVGPASATNDAIALFSGTTGKIIKNSNITIDSLGDVVGPVSSTDNALAVFDGATGKLLENSPFIRTGNSLKLNNNESLLFRNAADDADITALSVDVSDEVRIGEFGLTARINSQYLFEPTTFTLSASQNFANETFIRFRNSADSKYIDVMSLDASDVLNIGSGGLTDVQTMNLLATNAVRIDSAAVDIDANTSIISERGVSIKHFFFDTVASAGTLRATNDFELNVRNSANDADIPVINMVANTPAFAGLRSDEIIDNVVDVGAGEIIVQQSGNDLEVKTFQAGSNITFSAGGSGELVISATGGGGSGDVVGPASSTNDAIALFDGTTGKLLQNSNATIDASGNISTSGTVDGRDISADGIKLDGIEAGAQVNDVDSVFGRTGAVVAASGDYSASEVTNDSLVAGVTVTDALVNINNDISTHVTDTANPHSTSIANIDAGTLAQLNSAISDATLDDSSASRTPTSHAASHENGGADEIDVTGLSGLLADTQQITAIANSTFTGPGNLTRGINLIAGNNVTITAGSTITDVTDFTIDATGGSGTGDVVGPATAADGSHVLYDGTTGKLVKSGSLISEGGSIVTIANDSTFGFRNAANTATYNLLRLKSSDTATIGAPEVSIIDVDAGTRVDFNVGGSEAFSVDSLIDVKRPERHNNNDIYEVKNVGYNGQFDAGNSIATTNIDFPTNGALQRVVLTGNHTINLILNRPGAYQLKIEQDATGDRLPVFTVNSNGANFKARNGLINIASGATQTTYMIFTYNGTEAVAQTETNIIAATAVLV